MRAAYPWPDVKPRISDPPPRIEGWGLPEFLLKANLRDNTRIVLELGSWLGESARFMLEHAPNAIVICVDHWLGSSEHIDSCSDMLPHLYNNFLAVNWDHRDRLIPIREDTAAGLELVAEYGIKPDLIYIDASHDYEDVIWDLELSSRLFPDAQVIGDDYDFPGVRRAVNHHVYSRRIGVQMAGRGWQLIYSKTAE